MKDLIRREEKEILRGLGLTDTQITLYVTLLKHNVLSILELSTLTGVNRVQIYSESEKLINLGLFEIARRDKRKYIAAEPRKLVDIAKRNAKNAEELVNKVSKVVPGLETFFIPKKGQVVTKYYEGIDKIFEAYDEMLNIAVKANKDLKFLTFGGSLDDVLPVLNPDYWNKWNEKFERDSKSSIRMLVNYSDVAKAFVLDTKRHKPETRYVKNFPMESQLEIFNDVVFINSFKDELGIWIESRVLAESYRLIFELLWSNSSEFK